MRVRKFLAVTGILLAGMAMGFVVTGHFGLTPNSEAKSFVAPVPVETPPLSTDQLAFIDQLNNVFTHVAGQASPSVVTIFSSKVVKQSTMHSLPSPFEDFFGPRFFQPRRPQGEQRLRGMGSGVIVSGDGYILTNNHVIAEAEDVQVMLHGGRKIKAEVVGADAKTDIAVIKIETDGLKPLPLGNSDNLRIGEWVVAIGSPLSENLDQTVTKGIVSAKGRSNVGLVDYEDFIQTDAAINPGNSGGALVNLKGELVGINTAIASRSGGFQGIGFAVPANMAKQIMDALIEHGKVTRGWLGVGIQEVDESIARAMGLPGTKGALVTSVQEGSPADKAGLKEEDFIVSLDGEAIEDVNHLRNEVASRLPGSKVELKIWREEREKTVTVKLAELSDDAVKFGASSSSEAELGFSVQTLTDDLARRLNIARGLEGVVITRISQGTPAYEAGLRQGDLITSVNRQDVGNIREFRAQVESIDKGETVLFYVHRNGRNFFVAYELN